jgi:D-tyrosyl-tRNA(Tyr) deacylase
MQVYGVPPAEPHSAPNRLWPVGIMIRAMRGLVQRVSEASVTVDGEVVGWIGPGLCVLVGVGLQDDEASADRLAAKIWQMRLFPDAGGNLNRSAAELGLAVLVISQFTLYADTSRGRRPSFRQGGVARIGERTGQPGRRPAAGGRGRGENGAFWRHDASQPGK